MNVEACRFCGQTYRTEDELEYHFSIAKHWEDPRYDVFLLEAAIERAVESLSKAVSRLEDLERELAAAKAELSGARK